jgi:hypothetical protein
MLHEASTKLAGEVEGFVGGERGDEGAVEVAGGGALSLCDEEFDFPSSVGIVAPDPNAAGCIDAPGFNCRCGCRIALGHGGNCKVQSSKFKEKAKWQEGSKTSIHQSSNCEFRTSIVEF